MTQSKCSLKLYSNFLIGNHNRYSCLEMSKVVEDIAHDAISRWLYKSEFNEAELWNQVKTLVDAKEGYLVCDDTVLDKRYSRCNELARKQYSGDVHGIVNGIGMVNLLWTDSQEMIPVDYRIYQKAHNGKTKNDLFQEMLKYAKQRGFSPRYILMDAWYTSLANLKSIRNQGRKFICNLKTNRIISRNRIQMPLSELGLTDRQVSQVWLKGFGLVLVCKVVATNGDITYLATNDLSLTDYDEFISHFQYRWHIEEFHRALKQTTGIEQCYSIKARSQKTHIFAAIAAFVKLEIQKIKERISWYEQKALIPRFAVSNYIYYSSA